MREKSVTQPKRTQPTVPPTGMGRLAKKEQRLAWSLLLPTVASILLVIILPLMAIFWISFKPIELADLRRVIPKVYERITTLDKNNTPYIKVEYQVRNPSQKQPLSDVVVHDILPDGIVYAKSIEIADQCTIKNQQILCIVGNLDPAKKQKIGFIVPVPKKYSKDIKSFINSFKKSRATAKGIAEFPLLTFNFTLQNFVRIFDFDEFISVLFVTVFYTVFGTVGALVVGLMGALILNVSFKGRGILRGFLLFPYVAPVIAVAFTWVNLFDPFSGSVNALLLQMGVLSDPINFFGQKPTALITVTVFEIWRYFPLSFLFILARMQSIETEMYEAADMDGASPLQKFWFLSLPQLLGILSTLFLLRFIWTFNKFDDIFLLTGGNAGTRTLTVNVYEQAFALSNIGAGAAVAVIIFMCLLIFVLFFLKFINKEEGLG